MNKLWLALLQKAIQCLLAKDWDAIVIQVYNLLYSQMPGDQKRQIVFETLRGVGVSAATWLLYAGIEIAYGKLKNEAEST